MPESHVTLFLAAQWIKYVDCVGANLKPGPRLAMCCSLFLQGKQLVLQQDEEILDLKGAKQKMFHFDTSSMHSGKWICYT